MKFLFRWIFSRIPEDTVQCAVVFFLHLLCGGVCCTPSTSYTALFVAASAGPVPATADCSCSVQHWYRDTAWARHTRSWSLLPERRRGREEPRCTPGAAHSDPGPWQPTTPLQPCQSIRDLGLIFTTNFIVQLYVNVWTTVKWLMSCKIPKCGHRSVKIWFLAARDISIRVTET